MNDRSNFYYPVYYEGIEISTHDYISKGYFSKQFIEKNPNLIINVTDPKDGVTIFQFVVTDNNRVQQIEINQKYIH